MHPAYPQGPHHHHHRLTSGLLRGAGPRAGVGVGWGERGHPIHPRRRPPITAPLREACAEGRARRVTPGHWPRRPGRALTLPTWQAVRAGGACTARGAGAWERRLREHASRTVAPENPGLLKPVQAVGLGGTQEKGRSPRSWISLAFCELKKKKKLQ